MIFDDFLMNFQKDEAASPVFIHVLRIFPLVQIPLSLLK
jgi:hypothetical protein